VRPGRRRRIGEFLRAVTVKRAASRARTTRGTSLAVAAGLAALLVLWNASPASAQPPARFRNLNPSHFNGQAGGHHDPNSEHFTNESQIASDRFDGRDELLTMRAIASATARYYEWYLCNPDDDAWTIWNRPEPCDRIAIDTTPTLSLPAPGVEQVATFEATLDILPGPPFANPSTRQFRTAACIEGPPSDPAHCVTDHIHGVHFDDGSPLRQAPHPPTTAGQITEPAHGGVVANAGFTAVAFTSVDDIGRLQFCLTHSEPGGPPWAPSSDANPRHNCHAGSARDSVPNDTPACAVVPPGAYCWEAILDPPDGAEFLLGIVEQDDPTAPVESGSGDCEGDTTVGTTPAEGEADDTGDDCQFDKIYLTSVQNPPQPPSPGPGGGGGGGPGGGGSNPGAFCPGFEGDVRNQVVGGQGGDELQGTPGPDVICGLGGPDVLRGLGDNDLLIGGGGVDQLKGSAGRDRLRGESGGDALAGGAQRDRLSGGRGSDRCAGGPGRDGFTGCERMPGALNRPG
jgi:hypothetical protein